MDPDFFDDDLSAVDIASQEEEGTKEREIAQGLMDRQKRELSGQAATAASEIERLHMKQIELEKERSTLEDLSRRQAEYEDGKREMIETLDRSIVLLEKEEVQAARMAELLSVTRSRFSDALAELKDIDEESWADGKFQLELNRAMVLVEDARTVYKKGMARVDASSWHKGAAGKGLPVACEPIPGVSSQSRGFGFWLKLGLAFSLPIALSIIVCFAVWLVLVLKRVV